MLKYTNVSYQYQQQDFYFDISIPKGSLVAVLGSSGAGKSTLLNLAAGFIHPQSGHIEIAGKNVNALAPHLRPLSILFQEQNLFAHLSVADNIGLGLDPGLKLSKQQTQRIVAMTQKLAIDSLLTRFPEQLSGGQKQRVALARCFVQNRPLILLDEPFSALDPILRSEMLVIVKALAEVNNVTVLMVTHHLADALSVADGYIFVEDGQISSTDKIAMLNESNPNTALRKFVQASR